MDKAYNEWDFFALSLKPIEVDNPLLVIKDFFSDDSLAGHLERLKEWRDFVLKEDYYRGMKGSPAGLLHFYKLNIRLVEATHLLKEGSYPDIYQQITGFFKAYNLPQYREQLGEWLEYGLSNHAAREFIETIDLVTVYENLEMLYAALWTLHQKADTKLNNGSNDTVIHNYPDSYISRYQLNKAIPSIYETLISEIIAKIRHKLPSVQAVIYLGTPTAIGDKIYLLVFTSNDEQRQAQSLASMIEESCREIANVAALVHHASTLFNGINNNNQFFNSALSCPVVYLSGDLLLPARKSFNSGMASEAASFKWQRWQNQGRDFLSGAGYYYEKQAYNAALFSLHQAAECLLTAIIRAVIGYGINNHNLSRLLAITGMFTGDLIEIFELGDIMAKERFELLKHAYTNVRYKDSFEADPTTVEWLMERVTHLAVKVEDIYSAHLNSSCL